MTGKDVFCKYKTGSGKTLAYLLPQLKRLTKEPYQTLILVPTRELASQIVFVLQKLLNSKNPSFVQSLTGGIEAQTWLESLKKTPPYFLIATPDILWKLFSDPFFYDIIPKFKTMIVDEPDSVMKPSSRFISPSARAHRVRHPKAGSLCIQKMLDINKKVQLVFVSATVDSKLKNELKKYGWFRVPLEIRDLDIEKIKIPVNVKHQFIICEEANKLEEFVKFLNQIAPKPILVFLRNGSSIIEFILSLKQRDIEAIDVSKIFLDSAVRKESEKYEQELQIFLNGKVRVLVAIEESARGLDFPDLEHVFVFDFSTGTKLPYYIHMAGRTGRLDKPGTVTCIISPDQMKAIRRMEGYLQINYTNLTPERAIPEKPIDYGKKSKKKQEAKNAQNNPQPSNSNVEKLQKSKDDDTQKAKEKPKDTQKTKQQSEKFKNNIQKTKQQFGKSKDDSQKIKGNSKDTQKTKQFQQSKGNTEKTKNSNKKKTWSKE